MNDWLYTPRRIVYPNWQEVGKSTYDWLYGSPAADRAVAAQALLDLRNTPVSPAPPISATPQALTSPYVLQARKKSRRTRSQLSRNFSCKQPRCDSKYEAWRSLQRHLLQDHDVKATKRSYLHGEDTSK